MLLQRLARWKSSYKLLDKHKLNIAIPEMIKFKYDYNINMAITFLLIYYSQQYHIGHVQHNQKHSSLIKRLYHIFQPLKYL